MKISDMKTIYQEILDLLKTQPELRNSDKMLILAVWKNHGLADEFDNPLPLEWSDFHELVMALPDTETIRRTRQYIQKEFPELQSRKRIERERRKRETGIRKTIVKEPAEELARRFVEGKPIKDFFPDRAGVNPNG